MVKAETEVVVSGELQRLDAQSLISQAIQAGSGIETMERLVALAHAVQDQLARRAWYAAMAEFQRLCPRIKKTSKAKIMTRGGGSYEYNFSSLDEMLSVVLPVMGPLGLSVSWIGGVAEDGKNVWQSCRISHVMGHAGESGKFVMPIQPYEGSGANPSQRVGIALTYARRYSFMSICGIAPEDDLDGSSERVADDGKPAVYWNDRQPPPSRIDELADKIDANTRRSDQPTVPVQADQPTAQSSLSLSDAKRIVYETIKQLYDDPDPSKVRDLINDAATGCGYCSKLTVPQRGQMGGLTAAEWIEVSKYIRSEAENDKQEAAVKNPDEVTEGSDHTTMNDQDESLFGKYPPPKTQWQGG